MLYIGEVVINLSGQVLPRDAMQAQRMSSCGVCVQYLCLSVCVSVTFVHSVKMNKYIMKIFFATG